MTSSHDVNLPETLDVHSLYLEERRLAALERYNIIDTAPEPQFDRLVALAARFFDLPMALVSFIGEQRQWFKANHGIPSLEVPRYESFCQVTITQDGPLLVPDTTLDERFRSYPSVHPEPHVRSYAGAPLTTPDGLKIGTFCVFGPQPRTFSEEDEQLLLSFAEMAMAEVRLRQALRDLKQLAMHDALTGIPNRVQFRRQLVDACHLAEASQTKVVLGLLDLDRFKLINDTFGHTAGDSVLREIAHRLLQATRTTDVVARLGGDEFVLLLTDVRSVADVATMINRFEKSLAVPFLIGDQEVFIHWSLGLSVYPDDTKELDLLFGHADAAMYRVKRAGGGHAAFQATQDLRTNLEMERLAALHRAIERDELRLHFQPIVYARGHAAVGHEALLRWVRPSGIVSPLDFIPLAETSGLIIPIGHWVIQQAVAALKSGQIHDVSVNVSALEFRHPDFVQHLRDILSAYGVEPRRLWLELTESILLEPRFVSVLQEVRKLGVRTALDDFGTGYSSLAALTSLPIQIVKIDRSFIQKIEEETAGGRQALEVVRGIVTLANAYGLPTVAEGVETSEQADLLLQVGCTYLQGYFFGRPQPLA